VAVYRALPEELTVRISEHGSRRVLEALASELVHRSPAELATRIARNWEHWRYRLIADEPVRDGVALAIRLARRGLDCPDVRCEDGPRNKIESALVRCRSHASGAACGSPTR
jgi:hypothetical protein